MAGSRFVDTRLTPQNLRALWDRIGKAADDLAAAQATITQQAATIASLQATQDAHAKQITQALILAGKQASQTATGVSPAPGGGGGSGGSQTAPDHPDYLNFVLAAKQDLVAGGDTLLGADGSWRITNLAVKYINNNAHDPGAGLLSKPAGNNSGGYSVDTICFQDGAAYDVLIGAGDIYNPAVAGANTPQWSRGPDINPSLWRPGV